MTTVSKESLILTAALVLAEEVGIRGLVATTLSARSGIPHASFFYHYGSMDDLRDEVVRKAIVDNNMKVIGKALAEGHVLVQDLDHLVKSEALQTLI